MRSDLNNVPEMADEARERALQYAMSIETAQRNTTGRADDLWLNASNLAMDARDAALMTIDSALMATCRKYRQEHDETGYCDLEEDAPGFALSSHECPKCAGLQAMARQLSTTLGDLWRGGCEEITKEPGRLRRVKNLHNLLLGQVHLGIGLADEHVRTVRGEE